MGDSDLINLYSGRLLALAAAIPLTGRLPAPQGSASRRSPVCGSTITADVVLEGGRVAAFAQEVRACALGQASAAILGAAVIGRSRGELESACAALQAMLEGGPVPAPPFAGYEVLLPARDYRNRHASIMLALQAACAAVAEAEAESAGRTGAPPTVP